MKGMIEGDRIGNNLVHNTKVLGWSQTFGKKSSKKKLMFTYNGKYLPTYPANASVYKSFAAQGTVVNWIGKLRPLVCQ